MPLLSSLIFHQTAELSKVARKLLSLGEYAAATLCFEKILDQELGSSIAGHDAIIHRGVFCSAYCHNEDLKDEPLTGYRYICVVCANYDTCQSCFDQLAGSHMDGHSLVRIPSEGWIISKLRK